MTDVHRQMPLPLISHWVNNVRSIVSTELDAYGEGLVRAAQMVATELAENVVRYGEAAEGTESGMIVLDVTAGMLEIRSSNGASEAKAKYVLAAVARLQDESAEELYLERMKSMLSDSSDRFSQLGLIRIVYEGGFSIHAAYEDSTLKIVARREVS